MGKCTIQDSHTFPIYLKKIRTDLTLWVYVERVSGRVTVGFGSGIMKTQPIDTPSRGTWPVAILFMLSLFLFIYLFSANYFSFFRVGCESKQVCFKGFDIVDLS